MAQVTDPVRFSLAMIPAVLLFTGGAGLWPPTALGAAGAAGGARGRSPESTEQIEAAIGRAVADRMGPDVSVSVDLLRADVHSSGALAAIPDPGGRAGQPVRFVLTAGGARAGVAIAAVGVRARHARAARAIERDETLTPAAIEIVTGELSGLAFRRLPAPEAVVGLRARRAIAPGEPLTGAVLDVPPTVQSGDEVSIRIAIGPVEVTSTGIASGSGHVGDTIRVVSSRNRRGLKARIVGRGAVEVVE